VSILRRLAFPISLMALLPGVAGAQAGFRAGLAFETGRWEYGQGFSLEGSYTDWAVPGSVDTMFRCSFGIGGRAWERDGGTRGSSNLRR
jgi:hypothetical protein